MTIPEWLDTGLKIGGALFGAIGGLSALFIRSARRGLATKTEVAAARIEIQALDRRMGTIETEVRHLPTGKDIAALVDRIAKVEGSMQAVSMQILGVGEQLTRVDGQLGRLVDFHLKEPAR